MNDFSVFLDTLAPEPGGDIERALNTLMALLAPYHGVVNGDGRGWGAVVSVDAVDVATAHAEGVHLVVDAARRAGLPAWPVVDVRVVRGDVLAEENDTPNYPDLVSGPEAAAILGVTRQRVHQLRQERADFPKPLYELATGPLWTRSGMEVFAERSRGRATRRRIA